ncbi:BirA family transcriptional regulator, biotin operon repressor / biotin-[acetyl-CoA-carboxylase] ligase [Formivibrio citricus]|uniref:Bifunctional ligase/repressor BirA n=1 Tax=Formivibrio citricus TaxID=83765 RepID=A0A1I5DQ08_9NEIS|nr:biotin--[acetyl-CoA-carboxylase] ligase [Formivibrio citricus]SFO01362.1 BirA family transcriptional regulator, biotin operon repressor / biotin-[acetyl-CoA-carboxylase] ligase [Formivibrio citricus]
MFKLIACLRQLDADRFISGEVVAEKLGISRAGVSMTLARAEEYGIAIERRHGLGYRLHTPIEWLDPQLVAAGLAPGSALKVSVADSIESTNQALQAKPEHGRVLAAEWQSGGRGRMGRSWQGGIGGSLLFSLAWTFLEGPAQLVGLPLAVGVALARAIHSAGVTELRLKWPNDLLLPAGKAGGILLEMQGDAMGPAQVAIGIGINLRAPQSWNAALDQSSAGLQECGLLLGRNALLGRSLAELEQVLEQFSREGFAPFRSEWEQCHAWQGSECEVRTPDGRQLAGTALGVAEDGALRMQVAEQEKRFYSADVSLRRAS